MDSADSVLQALLHQTTALGAASAAVLLLRPLLGRGLGAHAAYLAWFAVPCTLLATWAAPVVGGDAVPVVALARALAPAAAVAPALPAPGGTAAACLLAVWAAGAGSLAAWAWRRQRRFEAALRGAATAAYGMGPVVIGVWRPRLWLPADFDQRFGAAERALILAHEQVHLRRRDNAWNLLAFALLVLHWFNPLAWWAWQRMRRDQELSCDALALAQGLAAGDAAAPVRYVQTLVLAQGLGDSLLPAGPTGAPFFSHPLVERIRVLKSYPLPRRLAAARVVALAAGLCAGVVAVALEAAPAGQGAAVMTQIELQIDGRTVATPGLLGHAGQPMTVALDDAAGTGRFAVTFTLSKAAGDHLQIDATLRSGPEQQVFASPRLITRDRTPARVDTTLPGSGRSVSVTFTPARQ